MTQAQHVTAPEDDTICALDHTRAIGSPQADAATTSAPSLLDDAAFAAMISTHRFRLHKFVIRHVGAITEAEDLTSQAIAEAARLSHTFRGESLPSTWLYGIALNLIRNHLSRAPERRYEFVGEDTLQEQASNCPCPETVLGRSQTMHFIARAASELSPPMRAVFMLVDVHDASYEEAALQLGIPIGTVRSRLNRARNALKIKLLRAGIERAHPA